MLPSKFTLISGDCLEILKDLPAKSVQMCVTSPPYWGLRDYDCDGQLGAEAELDDYIQNLVNVFREVAYVLKDDGTLWLNIGDAYASRSDKGTKLQGNPEFNRNRPSRGETKTGKRTIPKGLKSKDLIGLPWRVAFALQEDGWYLRSDIIWHKPNPMPESVKDRPTKSHEHIFLFAKNPKYYYDSKAVMEDAVAGHSSGNGFKREERLSFQNPDGTARGNTREWECVEKRNRRDVWTVNTKPYKEAHFATFPPKLIEPCVLAGSKPGDYILDPFSGAGTSGVVALQHGRSYIGIELNPDYNKLAFSRIEKVKNEIQSI